jgi:hypothetical protein
MAERKVYPPVAVGDTYGRLTVQKEAEPHLWRDKVFACWWCECICGERRRVQGRQLQNGHTQSCGCLKRDMAKARRLETGIRPGDRFGMLEMLRAAPSRHDEGWERRFWLCRCDCGKTYEAHDRDLVTGEKTNCGCVWRIRQRAGTLAANTTHGLSQSVEYTIWRTMKQRCFEPSSESYHLYGGRGISVCDRWRDDFAAFYADMGPRPSDKHSIERIDNDGNYEPSNCCWATRNEQARNRRTNVRIEHEGKNLTIAEWAEITGLRQHTIIMRMRRGTPPLAPLSRKSPAPRFTPT